MPTFSFSEAFGAGFALVFRRPLTVAAWGGVMLLAIGVPGLLLFAWVGPQVAALMHYMAQQAQTGAQPDPAEILRLEGSIMTVQPLMLLVSVVCRAVLAAAVLRAVLEPQNSRFAYLRLGMQEVWVGLLTLAMGVMLGIAMVCTMLGVAVVAGIIGLAMMASHAPQGVTALAALAAGLIAVGVLVWGVVRLSLALPMTFAEREFRLFESWELTRGHGFKLFTLALALLGVVLAVGLVFNLVAVGVGMLAGGSLTLARMQALLQRPPQAWIGQLAPWLALVALVGSFLGAAFSTVMIAPWAVVYRQLRPAAGAV